MVKRWSKKALCLNLILSKHLSRFEMQKALILNFADKIAFFHAWIEGKIFEQLGSARFLQVFENPELVTDIFHSYESAGYSNSCKNRAIAIFSQIFCHRTL